MDPLKGSLLLFARQRNLVFKTGHIVHVLRVYSMIGIGTIVPTYIDELHTRYQLM